MYTVVITEKHKFQNNQLQLKRSRKNERTLKIKLYYKITNVTCANRNRDKQTDVKENFELFRLRFHAKTLIRKKPSGSIRSTS